MSRLSRNVIISIISISVVCIVVICCIGMFLGNPTGSSTPTPTTTNDISVIIMQTSNAAVAQTQLASSPTPHLTATNLPTLTQPATLIPSQTSQPTATFIFLVTAPTLGGGGSVCPCSGDTLNCGDFSTQSSAQACMNYCIAQGAGDIHNLDGDANGLACESLP